ncbi:peptidase inhibitor family I36 protein [Nocardia sp. CY41]|uniref:peptidase inhibitor family I36 protein n=1 Tax=Nocardia sp. CY41 TaxID=2608686 RepID=UPI001357CCA1|nr:peptidase inhibitor family I36 protein [Nocardia sp. CY41]
MRRISAAPIPDPIGFEGSIMLSLKSFRRLGVVAAATFAVAGYGAALAPAPASAAYDCPGGLFCGYDQRGGTGMFVQVDNNCLLHDIGNEGIGDRLSSYWNRTGKTVGVYNWTGQEWQLLVSVPDNAKGNVPAGGDNKADALWVCH